MSRWMMPSAWAASSASAISMASDRINLGFHRTPADAMLQRQPVQKLHGDERVAVLIVDFVDRANVGMVQRGSSLRLALEAGQSLSVFSDLVRQELQGHEAMQFYVFSLVDHAHPATAELFDNAVVRNGLADHGLAIMLG